MTKTVGELRRTVDLLALVGADTRLKRTGAGWWAGPCPFCGGEDRFTLKQTPDGWRWLCRHCTDGKYLDVVDYVQRRGGLDFISAVKALGGDLSSPPLRDEDLPPLVQPKPKPEPQPQDAETVERLTKVAFAASSALFSDTPLGVQVRDYLQRRGLLMLTWHRAMLGAMMVFDPKSKRERPALAIPYVDTGLKVRAIKFRFCNDEPNGLRYIAAKGSRVGLYYLPDALGVGDTLLVVEGEINLLSLTQVAPEGLDLVSTGSQTLTQTMIEQLQGLAQRYKRVIVWADEPACAQKLSLYLKKAEAIRSPVVDGAKWDANRMLQDDLLHDFVEQMFGIRCQGWRLKNWEVRYGEDNLSSMA